MSAFRQLTAAVRKCEAKGIDADITLKTVLSSGVTLLLAAQGRDGAAAVLESMAAAIRDGAIIAVAH